MNTNIFIKLKAALLLTVFSLNTVIGFACSAGIDMGFNSKHHQHEESGVAVHPHTPNKTHHHHDEPGNIHQKSKDAKDHCCNDEVIKFSQVDKAIPQSLGLGVNFIFFSTFVSSFYDADVLFTSQVSNHIRYFLRSYHSPILDIRIAIQSFQI